MALTLAVTGFLLVYNNLISLIGLAAPVYIAANLVVATTLVLLARRSGLSFSAIGFDRSAVPTGVRWGGMIAAVVAAAIALGLLVLRSRFPTLGAPSSLHRTLFEALVRVPVGTALPEEVLFRGVLFGLWARARSVTAAAGVSAVVFGLWHVGATIQTLHDAARTAMPLTVACAVAFTAGAGVFLAWGRIRTKGIWGPTLVHATANSLAIAAGYVARSL